MRAQTGRQGIKTAEKVGFEQLMRCQVALRGKFTNSIFTDRAKKASFFGFLILRATKISNLPSILISN